MSAASTNDAGLAAEVRIAERKARLEKKLSHAAASHAGGVADILSNYMAALHPANPNHSSSSNPDTDKTSTSSRVGVGAKQASNPGGKIAASLASKSGEAGNDGGKSEDSVGAFLSEALLLKEAQKPSLDTIFQVKVSHRGLTALLQPVLKGCTQLKALDLSFNALTSLVPLCALKQLRELRVGSNALRQLPDLSELSQLCLLHVHDNELTNLNGLKECKALASLRVSGNKLKTLDGKVLPASLTALDASYCELQRVLIERLPALKTLSLSGNPLSLPSSLVVKSCVQLEYLNLSYCRLATLCGVGVQAPLYHLPKLAEVNLKGNELASVAALPALPRLTSLCLATNKLASLSGLAAKCPLLASLDISGTRVYCSPALRLALAELKFLTDLRLEHTPAKEQLSLEEVASACPSLEFVDHEAVNHARVVEQVCQPAD
jgi:Leucine-rich repeat (LRR) protein